MGAISSGNSATRLRHSQQADVTTTYIISNLHCPSCVEAIRNSLGALPFAPEDIIVSVITQSVIVRHNTLLSTEQISGALDSIGFEVHSIFQDHKPFYGPGESSNVERKSWNWPVKVERAVSQWAKPQTTKDHEEDMRKKSTHLEQCVQCKAEQRDAHLNPDQDSTLKYNTDPIVVACSESNLDKTLPSRLDQSYQRSSANADSNNSSGIFKATLALSGMTCSSCVASLTHAVRQQPWVRTVSVNLLTNSSIVTFNGDHDVEEVRVTIEDCGFGASVVELEEITTTTSSPVNLNKECSEKWRASYTLGGMTCGSCVGRITDSLRSHPWVNEVDVSLIANRAVVTFKGKEHQASIKQSIEDAGYIATLDEVTLAETKAEGTTLRVISVRIDGMFCDHCPDNIIRSLRDKLDSDRNIDIDAPPLSLASPILRMKYFPELPNFTIRHILNTIVAVHPSFHPSIYHPPTIEERADSMHITERMRAMRHLILCIVSAIPTFVLGIVFMSLIPANNQVHQYIMEPMWAGNVTRLTWALWFLATPIYFYSASTFHLRAIKELRAMWRPGSRTPVLQRFTRFGSMNMLISLGTTIAYFASLAELILAARKQTSGKMDDSFFDAVVFLAMFLLIGRVLEAYSKAKTGDAVKSLGALRPTEAILINTETGDVKIAADQLEVGDVVRIHYGTSPPFVEIVTEGSSIFDESSLTGEARPVKKEAGDVVYSGTINKGTSVKIKITSLLGTSMLDQVIDAVREGQARRAPIERVADGITAHFVPFVIAIAIMTWPVWLILGTTGAIPRDWRGEEAGGWALWSLRFAIAVFVIACPCGIGLAAPTALFVGGGLAAQHGILVRGGGEAFQEASSLDCIVFDKTGTLTQGGDPAVTDHKLSEAQNASLTFAIVKALEENSSHPIARALVSFCNSKELHDGPTLITVSETPGKGMGGTFNIDGHDVAAIIGNEAYMIDHEVFIDLEMSIALDSWKARGESVALIALSRISMQGTWQLACAFSIADELRPEAIGVVCALKKRGIDVWMLSGDNYTTANAVGAQVGIPASNIIAGVLPSEKAEKIESLKASLTSTRKSTWLQMPFVFSRNKKTRRAMVAMVGDGINDAPALSTADVSIAIGSGSDIALSSSSFILINSKLTTILTLLDLSRVVFRRVYFNFGWALVYNLIAMPLAAGALYGVQSGGKHVRLDPVWASLAMALSSLSVVCSSLALKSRIPWVGFRARTGEEMMDKEGDGCGVVQSVC
jgi:heavy metal translocating P-type ATPase